jgi:hypothetical protein
MIEKNFLSEIEESLANGVRLIEGGGINFSGFIPPPFGPSLFLRFPSFFFIFFNKINKKTEKRGDGGTK